MREGTAERDRRSMATTSLFTCQLADARLRHVDPATCAGAPADLELRRIEIKHSILDAKDKARHRQGPAEQSPAVCKECLLKEK